MHNAGGICILLYRTMRERGQLTLQEKRTVSPRRRAARTFLQSACGMLAAVLLYALIGLLPQFPNWQLVLLILTASAAAAGIARMMN